MDLFQNNLLMFEKFMDADPVSLSKIANKSTKLATPTIFRTQFSPRHFAVNHKLYYLCILFWYFLVCTGRETLLM